MYVGGNKMARNKFPEETVKKILEISYKLFYDKGYDETSIQDIIDELGMSKGAIYHHFKSKEDILNKICEEGYYKSVWNGEALEQIPGNNALEKMRTAMLSELGSNNKRILDKMSTPLLKNPQIVARQLNVAVTELGPTFEWFIEAGNKDGSMKVNQPREAAQVIAVLINAWLNPSLFKVDREIFIAKLTCLKEVVDNLGIALVNEGFSQVVIGYYDVVSEK